MLRKWKVIVPLALGLVLGLLNGLLVGIIRLNSFVSTLGMIPFVKKTRGAHFIWHLFVLLGALLQWLGIWTYVF